MLRTPWTPLLQVTARGKVAARLRRSTRKIKGDFPRDAAHPLDPAFAGYGARQGRRATASLDSQDKRRFFKGCCAPLGPRFCRLRREARSPRDCVARLAR